MRDFIPVLLGSDINVYGMARAFHEAYGIRSKAFAGFQLSPTKYSKIVDVTVVPHFSDKDVFERALVDYARQQNAQQGEAKLLLIPCGDVYTDLISQTQEALRKYYAFTTIPFELNRALSYKDSFYRLCEKYGLSYPKTVTYTAQDVVNGAYRRCPIRCAEGKPIVMKPADSEQWLSIDFPGRKKAFIIGSQSEFEHLIEASYAAGYTGTMVVQEFVPGDDSNMRVLNAYVDQHHRVRMMFLGRPLLEDPTPQSIGNYAVIAPDYNVELFAQAKAFLEAIDYSGVANFDIKYDASDGTYKFFEINLRQGRSSYFVTLNGFNLAQYFAQDLIDDEPSDGKTTLGAGSKLWMEVPKSIFRRYVADGAAKDAAQAMIDAGHWGSTLRYPQDLSLMRRLLLMNLYRVYRKRYRTYFVSK